MSQNELGLLMMVPASSIKARVAASFTGTHWSREVKKKKKKKRSSYSVTGETNKGSSFFLSFCRGNKKSM